MVKETTKSGQRLSLLRSMVTILEPTSAASEAYRTLGTNLLCPSVVDHPFKVIVLTSPGSDEGKSKICANLGAVLAQAGKSTLVVDCDLRKPTLHEFFGLSNASGMGDVLRGKRKVQEAWTEEPLSGLKIVPAGPIPLEGPVAPLSFGRLSKFFDDARKEFDYVLVNAPSVGFALEVINLAAQGDGVLLVLDAQKTSNKSSVQQATSSLEAFGANVLGVIMSDVFEELLRYPEEKGVHRVPPVTKKKKKKKKSTIVDSLVVLLVSVILVLGVVRPFIVEAFYIPTQSMAPTFEVGDRVLANKFIYRFSEPERGDIIIFESPDGETYLTKRVLGLPGDTITVARGSLYVNDEPQRETYLNPDLPDESTYGPIEVPAQHVFVLGDNRANSADSRSIGPVPQDNIAGEAFLRVWPLNQLEPL
jgi:signal peptidase I